MAGFTYGVFAFTTTFTSTVPGTDDRISAVDWADFTINANGRNDSIKTGSGNDTITTGAGNDTISVSVANNRLGTKAYLRLLVDNYDNFSSMQSAAPARRTQSAFGLGSLS